ncbi:inositol monophosphatase family protein [Kineosporia babensis]|uniref:Inositol-1-monophosphatase n=1 Tax=Kineosporia babensis TaxID=499548 RepID=A0A9X1NJ74_9ACTN|nr:inositol monophosphatase family protein [Kineosporia babensis]MCD5314196.1 inositol monophosphatase [Kineosporia babensis]
MSSAGVDPAGLRELAEQVARAGGDLIRAGLAEDPDAREVSGTKSSSTDIVTAMDQAVERLLRERLAEARPADGLLGEEAGYSPGESGLTWVLDPIDGTVNYRYGIDAYAVSVAVVEGDPTVDGAWQPVAACVHNPATGETWTAGRGLGAQLQPGDGSAPRELKLGPPPELGQALVATGFGYAATRRAGQARVLTGVLPQVRDIRRIGSASLDLCGVATGTVDAYYERGVNVWDIAAAVLVLTEAGGALAGLRGAPAGGAMVVGAASPLLEGLCDVLGQLDADSDPT